VITLWRAQPQHRLPRMIFSLFFILAVLATIWQIRGATFSHIFAAIIGGVLIGEVFSRWYNHRGSANAVALLAAILVLSPASWQIVSQQLTADHAKAQRTAPDGQLYNAVCLEPEAYDALGSLASADVLTPIDLGMSLLIRSEHRVFGGPYHRNLLGIERVTRAYMSSPEDARVQINAMGATHVLYCAGLNETARYARLEPESFAAHMEQGILPDWLEPVDGKDGFDGVVRLYRVKPL